LIASARDCRLRDFVALMLGAGDLGLDFSYLTRRSKRCRSRPAARALSRAFAAKAENKRIGPVNEPKHCGTSFAANVSRSAFDDWLKNGEPAKSATVRAVQADIARGAPYDRAMKLWLGARP
jgi:hypothetical protein